MVHKTFERLPAEKKERILRAAREEFVRIPYEKTSINRILAAAGIPKGSFYQYFDDKSDLFSVCISEVYARLIEIRRRNGEGLLEAGLLRMKQLGYEKGYQLFSEDLSRYLSEEDFRLFENMLAAPGLIRSYVQTEAATQLIAPIFKEELMRDPAVRTDIDYDYFAYLLSLTEVIPVDYAVSTGRGMEEIFYLSYLYMRSVYDSIACSESEIRSHYRELTELLIRRNLTITTMESATAGQIASLITDTEGSSAVLKGAFITYSNEAKIRQGVPAQILEQYTVYSRETAEAMACACRDAYSADIGIGVTGTMGNIDPANPEASIPGRVYFAISTEAGTTSCHIQLQPQPSRLLYKLAVAEEVYKVLMEILA